MKIPDKIDQIIRERASSIAEEMSENTLHGKVALKEFAEYTGYKDAEDLLYYTLRTVAKQICYEKFLSGINV